MQETSTIHLPAGKAAIRPLYLLHISSGNGTEGEVNTVYHIAITWRLRTASRLK